MNAKGIARTSAGVLALMGLAVTNFAEAQPARPATPPAAAAPRPAAPAAAAVPVTQGPAIPGLCTMSIDQVIGTSSVGKFVATRMDQILGQIRAELQPEETAIENEGKAIAAARGTTDAATLQVREANLNVRYSNYQKKADQRQREFQATRDKALGRIYQEMEPVVRQVYQTQHCSILINREAVVVPNPAMDISGQIATALNAKITQFPFDRERLDTAPAGAAPAPGR